jgi:hypothetical protein
LNISTGEDIHKCPKVAKPQQNSDKVLGSKARPFGRFLPGKSMKYHHSKSSSSLEDEGTSDLERWLLSWCIVDD